MPKLSLKQKLKDFELRPNQETNNTPAKKPQNQNTQKENKTSSKRFKLPKINMGFKKKIPEPELPQPSKSCPKESK